MFLQEGRFAFKKEFTCDMTKSYHKSYKMTTKKLIARRWVLKQNWHVSSIIIRSKLNLLTEPENKNKQAAWIILLLSVNSTFLVREIFLKSSRILYQKTTRVGMKVSNYHFSCCYANSGQLYRDHKKYFLRLLVAIFVPYFFSFVFVIMVSTFFHDFF